MKTLKSILLNGYKDYLYVTIIDLKRYLIITICLFVIGLSIGFWDLLGINTVVSEVISTLFQQFEGSVGVALFFKIFFQNSRATLIIILSGIVLSIFPVFAILFNGIVIGCLLSNIEIFSVITKSQAVLYMIPHGMFEIPAVILAISLGIKFGLWPYKKNKLSYMKTSFIRSLQCYILVILPLLLIAGMIETFSIHQLKI
jgi:stage II sporulation protein M